MHSKVLQTCSFDEPHTAVNTANYLKDATEQWLSSSDKVIACVHDNASNMVLANRGLWESVPCFAHTLQLAINKGFGVASVKSIIAASSPLVAHFHHSTVAIAALCQKQQQQKVPEHKLIHYCCTRWNSVCDMFECLFEQRWTVCAVLSDRNFTKHADAKKLELKDEHWEIAEVLIPVLQSLKCATTAMCSETHVWVPIGLSSHTQLHNETPKHTNRWVFKSVRIQDLCGRISETAHNHCCWGCWESATASDCGNIGSKTQAPEVSWDRASRERVKEYLKQLYDTVTNPVTPMQNDPQPEGSAAMALDTLFGEDYGASDVCSRDTEVQSYLNEPCISVNQDPSLWWKVNENQFTKLSILAPATSVLVEIIFFPPPA